MLLVVAQLYLQNGEEGLHVTDAKWPDVRDLGLADASGEQIGCRPPRPAESPYAKAGLCQDRFLHVGPGPTRSLARVEVKEELVRDEQCRADIAFVGVGVTLTLREDAFRAYCDYLNRATTGVAPDKLLPSLRVMIRLPISAFCFPQSRGSDTPWNTPLEALAPMCPIARGDIDSVDVIPLEDRKYDHLFVGEVPLTTEALRLRGAPTKKGLVAQAFSAIFSINGRSA